MTGPATEKEQLKTKKWLIDRPAEVPSELCMRSQSASSTVCQEASSSSQSDSQTIYNSITEILIKD